MTSGSLHYKYNGLIFFFFFLILSQDQSFNVFYKRALKYLIQYPKESTNNLAILINWIRKLTIKNHKSIANILQDQYINILNSINFENTNISESNKKHVLELIFWLPKINRYLFSKLAILILNKNLSLFNSNHILGILKLRYNNNNSEKNISFS